MDIKKVKLSELKPDKKNARKHDKRNIWQALTGGKAIHEKTGEIFPG